MSHVHLEAPELWDYLGRWLPPAPAGVVDVGCGAGQTTHRLAELGYDTVGIDPEAPEEPGFLRIGLEQLGPGGVFDAAVAIRSLHHVHDLQAGVRALAEALRRGARLVVFEFAIEAVDDRALRWNAARGLAPPTTAAAAPEVTPLAGVRRALGERFRELDHDPVPYLAREAGRADLEQAERDAIVAGALAPAGCRLAYQLR